MYRANKSASRTIDILRYIASSDNEVSITELSNALNFPKSSVFELLYTLVEKKILKLNDANTKLFSLDLGLYEISSQYLAKLDLHKLTKPYMKSLVQSFNETVILAMACDENIVFLDKLESNSSIRTTCVLGKKVPMNTTALGKAILATYDDRKVAEFTNKYKYSNKTPYSILSQEMLINDVIRTRMNGYAIDNQENELEMFCIAVPLFNHENNAFASMSIALLASKINEVKINQMSSQLIDIALKISHQMGYRENCLYSEQESPCYEQL